MGKGDKKSKKGKIALGTYGNSRRKKSIKSRMNKSVAGKVEGVEEVKAESPAKAKKAPRKKAEA